MTHRILAPIKFFALALGLRWSAGKVKSARLGTVEPIVEPLKRRIAVDEWMFDRDGLPVTEAAEVYSHDLNRVSGALSGLRSLLTQIAAEAPVIDEMPNAVPFGPLETDDMLFEGEPMTASCHETPLEDSDIFIEPPVVVADVQELPRVA